MGRAAAGVRFPPTHDRWLPDLVRAAGSGRDYQFVVESDSGHSVRPGLKDRSSRRRLHRPDPYRSVGLLQSCPMPSAGFSGFASRRRPVLTSQTRPGTVDRQRPLSSGDPQAAQSSHCGGVLGVLGQSVPPQLRDAESPSRNSKRSASSGSAHARDAAQSECSRKGCVRPPDAAQRRPPCFSAKVAICSGLIDPFLSVSIASKLR